MPCHVRSDSVGFTLRKMKGGVAPISDKKVKRATVTGMMLDPGHRCFTVPLMYEVFQELSRPTPEGQWNIDGISCRIWKIVAFFSTRI